MLVQPTQPASFPSLCHAAQGSDESSFYKLEGDKAKQIEERINAVKVAKVCKKLRHQADKKHARVLDAYRVYDVDCDGSVEMPEFIEIMDSLNLIGSTKEHVRRRSAARRAAPLP